MGKPISFQTVPYTQSLVRLSKIETFYGSAVRVLNGSEVVKAFRGPFGMKRAVRWAQKTFPA